LREGADSLDETTEPGTASNRQIIRREGEYWTILYAGGTSRLKDTSGLRYLAYLLQRPYERISALEIERSTGRRSRENGGGDDQDPKLRERARVNVTRALSGALKRIAAYHPGLAQHLGATLRTGTFCTYSPDPRVPATWEG
jgi:hypothetical protein